MHGKYFDVLVNFFCSFILPYFLQSVNTSLVAPLWSKMTNGVKFRQVPVLIIVINIGFKTTIMAPSVYFLKAEWCSSLIMDLFQSLDPSLFHRTISNIESILNDWERRSTEKKRGPKSLFQSTVSYFLIGKF